ncbi:MAG: serine hydrolase domain-containing protein [Gemmatimonadaceae bacterium]|nr:serine hydrolase domain-containing protein [Gemmatimonadaceae bacterium]
MTTALYRALTRSVRRSGVGLAPLLLLAPLAAAQRGFAVPPARAAGEAQARLARIDSLLDRAVADRSIAGAVGLVLRDGKVLYERAVGWADRESSRRMTTDAMFRIASQTKALTSVSIMALVEQGRLSLDDRVSDQLPSFARTTVQLAGGAAAVPARRQITIRDLLTHTAGVSYGTDSQVADQYRAQGLGPAAGWGWYTADKDEPICTTMDRLGTLPFVQQPGAAFVYGYSTDILGCVVERVSGLSLEEFFRTRLTVPLRMRDTHFFVPDVKRSRFVTVYASDSARQSVRAPDGARGQGHYADGPRRSFSGGAGLVSTAGDYARFLQMLLNGGVLDGRRVLAPRTVELMSTNQTGTLFSNDGRGFGLGFATVDRLGADGFKSVGAYGWGGAYGSSYTVDPKERLVIVFMVNQLPLQSDIAGRFTNLVYQALLPSGR